MRTARAMFHGLVDAIFTHLESGSTDHAALVRDGTRVFEQHAHMFHQPPAP